MANVNLVAMVTADCALFFRGWWLRNRVSPRDEWPFFFLSFFLVFISDRAFHFRHTFIGARRCVVFRRPAPFSLSFGRLATEFEKKMAKKWRRPMAVGRVDRGAEHQKPKRKDTKLGTVKQMKHGMRRRTVSPPSFMIMQMSRETHRV